MKKCFFNTLMLTALTALLLLLFAGNSSAQSVAVNQNGSVAHSSAMLDVSSTNKGILIPRMATNQRTGIPSPATGLLVYDTDLNTFMYFNGSGWTPLSAAAAPGGNEWKILGNSGTDAVNNFIGTTDNIPLSFRINNQKAGRLDVSGNALYGYLAGANILTGTNNIAIGMNALFTSSSGKKIVAIGDSSLFGNTGLRNTAVGSRTLYANGSAGDNSAFGFEALLANTIGSANSAFGSSALRHNGNGYQNSAFGNGALFTNNNGNQNTAIGYEAMYNNSGGYNNTAVGVSSMHSNLAGYKNTAVGMSALDSNTSGFNNTALGFESLKENMGGSNNTAIGASSLLNNTGGNNTAVGTSALVNTSGSYNTAVGMNSFGANTTGTKNTALGYHTEIGSATLVNATAIGADARVDASNSMVLGSIGGINSATTTTKVGIGTTTPQTRLHIDNGYDAGLGSALGYLIIGNVTGTNVIFDDNEIMARNNGNTSPLYLQGDGGNVKIGTGTPSYQFELSTNSAGKPGSNTWTIVSDARLKKDVQDFKDGLSIIEQINPVWFHYNGEAGIKDTAQFVGILAQDIKKIAPYMVGEYKHKDNKGNETNYLNYDGNAMTYILINAIKELQAEIEALKKQIKKD